MSPFTPSGEQSRWRIVYDILLTCNIGDLVTYESLGRALDLFWNPGGDRHLIQMAVRRAAREYLEQEKRALEVVRNEGYRVTEATERPRLVRKHSAKLKRTMQRGHDLAVHVDYSGLDMEARRLLENAAATFYAQMQVTKALLRRQARLDEALTHVATKQERSDSEMEQMRERMADLERRLNERTEP